MSLRGARLRSLAMEYRDGRIQDFEIKFRSIDEDTERYLLALVDLLEAGKIEKVPGRSLHATHYDEGYAWILDCYFERRLFDLVEAYFTPSGEVFFGPIHSKQIAYMDRLVELGEAARVRRMWRAHVGLMKPHYWFFVAERDKGFEFHPEYTWHDEAEQRAEYEHVCARVPELKETFLAVMTDYRAFLESTNATPAELARIDADIAAIDAEKRPRPEGKNDTRSMTVDVFWELIDQGLGEWSFGERLESLVDRLALFKPAAIRKFDAILREMDAAAYRVDVWALAYLLQGGCSDDSFDAFRGWLIMQGRAVFDATLLDPDAFDVSLHHGQSGGMDILRDAAPTAYELRAGKPMKPVKAVALYLKGDEIDEAQFEALLPRIASAVD